MVSNYISVVGFFYGEEVHIYRRDSDLEPKIYYPSQHWMDVFYELVLHNMRYIIFENENSRCIRVRNTI